MRAGIRRVGRRVDARALRNDAGGRGPDKVDVGHGIEPGLLEALPESITSIGDGAFDGKFCDITGETELEQTAANLAGYTFNNIGGKWIKQTSVPPADTDKASGECGVF